MSQQHTPSDTPTPAEHDSFDIAELSKELQMAVSFAILDLDVAKGELLLAD